MPKLTPAQMKAAVEEFKKRFTPGYYHGSPSNKIKAFDSSKAKDPDLATPGVTFVTRDPDFAESFLPGTSRNVYKSGATMYPVSVNLGKHWDPNTEEGMAAIKNYLQTTTRENPSEGLLKRGDWTEIENPDFLDYLRKQKYDTFHVMEGGIPNVGIFDPKNIRGKFAKYNPEKAESPDFMKAEGGPVGYAPGGKVGALEALVKKLIPQAEREANKAKFLQGTKVVDYNGKPITMYHHTTDFKGDAFNPALAQQHDRGYHGQGMYFGADDYLKRSAFGKHSSGNVYGEEGFAEGSQIMPVHLSIKNPKYVDVTEQSLHGMPIQQLKEMGYDGVIVTRDDSFKNVMGRTIPRQKVYNAVAFDPTQIKSATGNTGTYNPLDPDITKAEGGRVFNPEGADYDYQTAMAYGMGPTGTGEDLGHWGSVAPTSDDERMLRDLPRDAYVMLKGKAHETFDKAEAAEKERGSKIVKIGDRYYSLPK